mgnify:CR=1 FL=1
MKKYFSYLLNNIVKLLVVLIVSFLFSFLTIEYVNQNRAYYQATFEVSNIESFNDELLLEEEFLNEIKNSAEKYKNIDVEKMLEKKHFTYTKDKNTITIQTKIKYYDDFFLSSSNSVGTRAKMFIKDSVLNIAGESNEIVFSNPKDIVERQKYINRWNFSFAFTGVALLVELIVSIFLYNKQKEETKYVYDNETMFASCFHKKYWKLSVNPFVKVKDITVIAMLFALMLASKMLPLPSGFGDLGISFTYLFFAIICMIYGPVYGFVVGVFSDIIGFFMPSGGGIFNFGYTLQAALTGMIYGLFFFKTKVTFTKVLAARILVNFVMNVIYGSFLYIFVYYVDDTMTLSRYLELVKSYALLLSLPKNIVYLLPQSLLLYYVIKVTLPIFARFNLVSKDMIIRKDKN